MARWMARGGLTMVAALVAVVSLVAGSARAADTDGDGFPDGLEAALGSDFQLATSTPTGSPAVVQPFLPGVTIFLQFQANDSVLVTLDLAEAPASLEGKRVAFAIGGVSACVTLDASGTGVDPNTGASASVLPGEGGGVSVVVSLGGDLAANFVDEGLTQSVQGIKGVKIDAAVFFNDIVYADASLNGIYQPTALPDNTTLGIAFFNVEGTEESKADLTLDDVAVTPSPAPAGATVTINLDLKAKGIDLTTVVGVVDFGDGSPEQVIDETQLDAITHVYAAEGVYDIEISLLGNTVAKGDESSATIAIDATAFAVIGDDAVVNSNNGLVSSVDIVETVNTDPTAVNFSIKSLMDAEVTGGTTEFESVSGTETQTQAGLNRDVEDGLFPSRSAVASEMVVAKTTTKSASGQNRGVIRKTVAVGSRNAKPNDSANPKPPKTNPGVVTVSKVSGKFIFKTDSNNKPDQVTFSGSITLPEGFSLENPNGVRFAIGLGNVLDGVMLDAKGKPKITGGDNQRLKKVQIKFPKLSGPATGTETAKITVTMSTTDMDLKGFESEGITNRVRDDEQGRKSVDRFMQVNLLLAGEPYEAYIPVEFKLAPKGDAGSMITRGVK